VTNPVTILSFYRMLDIDFPFDFTQYFVILHTIGLTGVFHPSSAPHFKTFKVLLELRLEF
jgi:hypothetical protein